MKRILTIMLIVLTGAVAFHCARTRKEILTQAARSLESTRVESQSDLAAAEAQEIALRDAVAASPPFAPEKALNRFGPALEDWLAAGDFSNIPASLVTELRSALALAGDGASDYVLISKPTMRTLRPRSPGKNDKLPDDFCGLLSIGAEEQSRIETALGGARKEFADWAKQNVVRETPGDETLVRYTLPGATDYAEAVTNRLMATISSAIGPERTSLLRAYAETWFQIEMGYLGGVTNRLEVLKRPDDQGRQVLFYKLWRRGANSSMSQGPAVINPSHFPAAWRNVFPGGWAEVAEREGLELPFEPKSASK